MPERDRKPAEDSATILEFPTDREGPRSSKVSLDGESVTIIYLPWPHEVEGAQRPAGLYYQASDTSGFYPDPTVRGLEAVLEEARPHLERHLRLVRGSEGGPADG